MVMTEDDKVAVHQMPRQLVVPENRGKFFSLNSKQNSFMLLEKERQGFVDIDQLISLQY